MPDPKYFDKNTSAWVHGPAVVDVTGTADGTYSANEQTLINDLKAAVNLILAALRSNGSIAT
jgi:hypothetical protein